MIVHIKDPFRGGFFSLCNLGYSWPSSIAFDLGDVRPATCTLCIRRAEEIISKGENDDSDSDTSVR